MSRRSRAFGFLLFATGLLLSCLLLGGRLMGNRQRQSVLETFALNQSLETEESQTEILEQAWTWNERLKHGVPQRMEYEDILSQWDGVMSMLTIPAIDLTVPIYHGCSESSLSKGAGHLESSALPVGTEGGRCVLSAHRGLPSSMLFTRLDELQQGDVFFLETAGMKLAYEVFETKVVDPEDQQALEPVAGQDLVTLLTCTPYGLNTHRLLVNGKRIPLETVAQSQLESNSPSVLAFVIIWMPWLLLAGCAIGLGMVIRKRGKQ